MELLELYSKEKANFFFCLIKLLFIKVRCLVLIKLVVCLEIDEGQQNEYHTTGLHPLYFNKKVTLRISIPPP